MPDISPEDLGTLLVYTLRYSLGRTSYQPADTCRMVQEYWPHVAPGDRDTMYRDMCGWLRTAPREDSERREWLALLTWMEHRDEEEYHES